MGHIARENYLYLYDIDVLYIYYNEHQIYTHNIVKYYVNFTL